MALAHFARAGVGLECGANCLKRHRAAQASAFIGVGSLHGLLGHGFALIFRFPKVMACLYSKVMITIHTLTAQDFDDWNLLWQAYLVFYESQLPEEVTRTAFDRMINPGEPTGGFLARDESGMAVGMVNWIDHRTNWAIGDSCYLQDLYVSKAGRGLGTGRALIEAVADAARTRHCARVYWQTHESNETAMILYDKVAKKSGFLVYSMEI
jgi:GNAT superfamily N-acetyltransferase